MHISFTVSVAYKCQTLISKVGTSFYILSHHLGKILTFKMFWLCLIFKTFCAKILTGKIDVLVGDDLCFKIILQKTSSITYNLSHSSHCEIEFSATLRMM